MRSVMQLIGPIGSFVMDGEPINGIKMVDVVVKFSKIPEGTKEVQIDIAGPGGLTDVGDDIYNYINSERSKYKIIMNQVGDIGSIMTKIWFASDERIALKGINPETGKPYEFMIHNPWTRVTGDSKAVFVTYEELKAEEEKLRTFYMNQLGVSIEGMEPLLDAESSINAEEAVALKFATSLREAKLTVAYMSKPIEKTLTERIDSLFALMEKVLKPKALALVLELEGDKKMFVATEDATQLEGKDAKNVDAAGAATAENFLDGTYNVKDGRKVTVASGKIAKVEVATATPAGTPAPAATVPNQVDTALAAKLDKLEAMITPFVAAQVEKTEAEKIEAAVTVAMEKFKASFKGGKPPVTRTTTFTTTEEVKLSPIALHKQKMKEKKEQSKSF